MQFNNQQSFKNYLLIRGVFVFLVMLSVIFTIAKVQSSLVDVVLTISLLGVAFIFVLESFFRPTYFSIFHDTESKQTYIDLYIPDNRFLIVAKKRHISRKRIFSEDEIVKTKIRQWLFLQTFSISIKEKGNINSLIDFSVFFNSAKELSILEQIVQAHNHGSI